MFLMTSSRFRRAIKDRILLCIRINRVIPLQFHSGKRTIQSTRGNHDQNLV